MDEMTINDFVMENKELLLNKEPAKLIKSFIRVGIERASDILKITDDKIRNGMPIKDGGTPAGLVTKIGFYGPDIKKLQEKYKQSTVPEKTVGGGIKRRKKSKKKNKSKKKKGKSKRKRSKTRRRR